MFNIEMVHYYGQIIDFNCKCIMVTVVALVYKWNTTCPVVVFGYSTKTLDGFRGCEGRLGCRWASSHFHWPTDTNRVRVNNNNIIWAVIEYYYYLLHKRIIVYLPTAGAHILITLDMYTINGEEPTSFLLTRQPTVIEESK